MHVLITTDQHASSLGGVQVSIRLQQRFLEKLGHRVSVVAPRLHRPDDSGHPDDITLPSRPITSDREYGAFWPGASGVRRIEAALADREPVDLVHVQGDYWGAITGYRFAETHALPVVHTMHNHLQMGIEKVAPAPGLVIRALLLAQGRLLRPALSRLPASAWRILHEYAARARVVTAPSGHFARQLEQRGVAPHVEVLWNGVDDTILDAVLAEDRPENARPVFLWTGRMSHEKRLLEFLEAVRLADVDAEVRLYGQGLLLERAEAFVAEARAGGMRTEVRFLGKVPYADSLRGLRAADALVQTSIGFETQGMTVFEAAALGTPAIVSDPNIAGELPPGICLEPADSSIPALAAALVTVAERVRAGQWERLAPSEAGWFRQSRQTEQMLEVYRRALAEGPRAVRF